MSLRIGILLGIWAVIVGVVQTGQIGNAHAAVPPESALSFDSYPVHQIYIGRAAPLSLKEELAKKYGDTLTAEATGPANFSGHFKLVNMECGNDCHRIAIVDLKTGTVNLPPFVISGINDWALRDRKMIEFRRDSELLIVHGTVLASNRREGTHYFRWSGARLEQLSFVPKAR